MGRKIVHAAEAWANWCGYPEDHTACQKLQDLSHPRQLAKGESLIHQGEMQPQIYIVASGSLRAVRYSKNGHEVWLADIEAPELVGEMGVLIGQARTSSVITAKKSLVYGIPSTRFIELMQEEPELGLTMSKSLAARLHQTSQQLEELTALPVSSRLHQELIRIAEPVDEDDEMLIVSKPPTVSAIAKRIHTSRESASRAFTQLEKRGLLQRQDKSLHVIKPLFD